jgi:hypothetical protein
MTTISTTLVDSLFNHLVLPLKLPGSKDEHLQDLNELILALLVEAGHVLFKALSQYNDFKSMGFIKSLETAALLNARGKLDNRALELQFSKLESDEWLILHVVEQNAGLLIYRNDR